MKSGSLNREWLEDFGHLPKPDEKPADFGAKRLPSLNSNNSIESKENPDAQTPEKPDTDPGKKLSSYERKATFCLAENVKAFCERFGIQKVGFLTLTFPDNLKDAKIAQTRFNSLASNYLREKFAHYVRVLEFQERGAAHYHLLVECAEDIRTGFNWELFEHATQIGRAYGWNSGLYYKARTAYVETVTPYLRTLWKDLRETMPHFGFGRSELLPVKTTQGGIANYVGKYMQAATVKRPEKMKGVRLVTYSQGAKKWSEAESRYYRESWRVCKSGFAWSSPGAKQWREKLALFAGQMECADLKELKTAFGPRWAYCLQSYIFSVPLPDENRAEASLDEWNDERRLANYEQLERQAINAESAPEKPLSDEAKAQLSIPVKYRIAMQDRQ